MGQSHFMKLKPMVVIAVIKHINLQLILLKEYKMKNLLVSLVVIITSNIGYVLADTSSIANINILPNISWEQVYNNTYCENKHTIINKKPNEIIVAGNFNNFKSGINQNKGIWVWKLNNDGHKIAEITINRIPIGNRISRPIRLIDLLVNQDESIWLIAEADFPRELLIKTNLNGDILMSREITGGMNISRALLLSDTGFLVIGDLNGKAFFMKIDATGKEVWRRSSVHNTYGKFYDGIPTKDGGFILVENFDATNNYALDGKTIFITKYSAAGVKLNEKKFSGRLGKLVVIQNDTFAILYDKNAYEGLGYWVKVYDIELNLQWSQNVAIHEYEIDNLNISQLNNDDYIISGQTFGDFKTIVVYVDKTGTKKWEYHSKVSATNPDIACVSTICYLVETIYNEIDAQMNTVNLIKVTKFRSN